MATNVSGPESRTQLEGATASPRTETQLVRDRVSVLHFGSWLAVIAICALVLRIVVVLVARSEWVASDGFWYSVQANQMAHGKFFLNPLTGRPDALHPPAWVVVLTALAWLGGHTLLQQQLLACVIGTATVVLVGLAGRRIAGERAGLVAAGIAAVYAGLWVYERALLSETLLLPAIATMVLVAYRFRDRPSARLAIWLGAICGLLALIRSEQILLLPVLVVPLILTARGAGWGRRLRWLGLAVLSVVVALAPWTIYNVTRFQDPVALSTGLGYAAAGANCDASYFGPNTGWTTSTCSYIASVRTEKAPDASVADSADRRMALNYAESHLDRVPVVLLAREGRAFAFWSPLRQTQLDSQLRSDWSAFAAFIGLTIERQQHATQSSSTTALQRQLAHLHRPSDLWVGRLALFSFWLLLVPAFVGVIVLRRRGIAIYPLLAFVATIVIAVAIAFGDTRYRAGAEITLVLLAAIGIDAVLPTWRSASPTGSAAPNDRPDRHDMEISRQPRAVVTKTA